VVIAAGAAIERCIVTDGVWVDAGRSYSDSILMRGEDGETFAMPLKREGE